MVVITPPYNGFMYSVSERYPLSIIYLVNNAFSKMGLDRTIYKSRNLIRNNSVGRDYSMSPDYLYFLSPSISDPLPDTIFYFPFLIRKNKIE